MYSGSRSARWARSSSAAGLALRLAPLRRRPAAGRGAPPRRRPPPPPRAPPGAQRSAASISPSSMRKPRILTWWSARPRNSIAPSAGSGPDRPCDTAAPRRSARTRGRARSAPPSPPAGSGTPAPAPSPPMQSSPGTPDRHRLQVAVAEVDLCVLDRAADRRVARRPRRRVHAVKGGADRRLGRTVAVDHHHPRQPRARSPPGAPPGSARRRTAGGAERGPRHPAPPARAAPPP